jgi:hypothetical protein
MPKRTYWIFYDRKKDNDMTYEQYAQVDELECIIYAGEIEAEDIIDREAIIQELIPDCQLIEVNNGYIIIDDEGYELAKLNADLNKIIVNDMLRG